MKEGVYIYSHRSRSDISLVVWSQCAIVEHRIFPNVEETRAHVATRWPTGIVTTGHLHD